MPLLSSLYVCVHIEARVSVWYSVARGYECLWVCVWVSPVHTPAKIPSYSPPCETGQTGVLVFPLTVGVHFFISFACRVD